jgi:hypothetical protein
VALAIYLVSNFILVYLIDAGVKWLLRILGNQNVLEEIADILREVSWFGFFGNLVVNEVNIIVYSVFALVWFIVFRLLARFVRTYVKK